MFQLSSRAVIAATIIARNYLAQARVLASSFLEQHQQARFVALIIDGDESDRDTPTAPTIVLPRDLGLPDGEWEQMAGVYSVMEFATAMKPALLRYLLTEGAGDGGIGAVLYLDPDIIVYRRFAEVFSAAERSGIALTPHVLHPLPRDGLEPAESYLMHAGLFNLGFICVGLGGLPFLDWWHERLRLDAVVDIPNALFTDQRWVDWVPTLFGGEVLRDHGLNVAYWNLHERTVTRGANNSLLAAGEPLKFFHFSGYDPDRPWQLSKHAAARPRCQLFDHPIVAQLCDAYSELLATAGFAEQRRLSYRLGSAPNGLRLTPTVRSAYRAGIKDAMTAGRPAPPAPFVADGGAAFAEWLMAPAMGPAELELGAWHLQLWRERPDLQAAFPEPGGHDASRFRDWLDADPWARESHQALHLPNRPRVVIPSVRGSSSPNGHRVRVRYGWNVVGYFSAEVGVGEAGRRMNLAIEGAGISTQLVAVPAPGLRQRHQFRRAMSEELRYRDSLFCVNADELERALALTEGPTANGDNTTDRGRRIGFWFWEVDQFPDRWAGAYNLLDEIWCASSFTAEAIAAVAPIPVRVVPLPVWAASAPTPFSRQQLGLPESFVFLFSYDFNSVFQRKNPLGLIEAYARAFGPHDGAALVLKSINGAHHPAQLEQARCAAGHRTDVVIIDGYVDAHRVQGMIERSDCFVSLHRSEGFGLHMAAAMASGRPVIATAYSGNLEFMDADSALLVPYELVPVGPGNDPYPASAHWAAPDLDAAATHLRQVFDNPALASSLAERGRQTVLERQGLYRASAAVGRLLFAAGSVRTPGPRPAEPLPSLTPRSRL